MFESLNDANAEVLLPSFVSGLCLFFKKLCPHCKNMEKVMEKVAIMDPSIRMALVDIEENPLLVQQFAISRAPTMLVLRNGTAVAIKVGLMNPRELHSLYTQTR